MNISVSQWLQAASYEVEMRRWRDESVPGKYKTVLVVHDPIQGISASQLGFFFRNFETSSYKLWHPCHKYIMWEQKTVSGGVHIAWESFDGKLMAARLRLNVPLERYPVPVTELENGMVTEFLDTDGNPLNWTYCTTQNTPEGIVHKNWITVPEKTPDAWVETHRRHNIEEVRNFSVAVPHLIQQVFGYTPDDRLLDSLGVIVPADVEQYR